MSPSWVATRLLLLQVEAIMVDEIAQHLPPANPTSAATAQQVLYQRLNTANAILSNFTSQAVWTQQIHAQALTTSRQLTAATNAVRSEFGIN